MSKTLTDRQRQILDFIYVTLEKQGVAPSLLLFKTDFKLASPFGVKRHIDALTAKGALRRLEVKRVPCCLRCPRPGAEH